jgi:hypothetical protein
LALLIGCLLAPAAGAQAFNHPGVRHSQADLDLMKSRVLANQQPWKGAYDSMLTWPGFRDGQLGRTPSSLNFQPAARTTINVGENENPHTGQDEAETDATAAYIHAMQWTVTGNAAHAQKTIQILNAWGNTLTSISGFNSKLAAAWIASMMCEASEIVRSTYTGPQDWTPFDNMMRTKFWPLLQTFQPGYNGNWDALITQAVMSIGVVLDDRTIYNTGRNYFLNGSGNGSLPNYVRTDGTTQETTRDQYHEQMGVLGLTNSAEIAWKQGEDLYATLSNRLLLGLEGTASRTMGNGTGTYSGWDIAYNHYHNRKGLSTPQMQALVTSGSYNGAKWSYNTVGLWSKLTFFSLGDPSGTAVASPTFSPAAGTYTGSQTVTLTVTTSGASIRYTTDGSTPSATVGTVYTGAFTVSASATIRAVGYKTGLTTSPVATAVYTIVPPGSDADPIEPSADTYVHGSTANAGVNYGTSLLLAAKEDGTTSTEFDRVAYLKFDLNGLASLPASATLLLYPDSTTQAGTVTAAQVATDGWTETGMTWNNRPAVGAAIASANVTAGQTSPFTINVTSFIHSEFNGDKIATIALTGNNAQLYFESSENGASVRPALVFVGGGATGPQLSLSNTSLTVTEGASSSLTVALSAAPAANVVVNISASGDADLTRSPASLTFTPSNWSTPQTVTVSAAQDADITNGSSTLTFTATGLTTKTASVTELDNDTQSLVVTPTFLTVTEGSSAGFTVNLAFQPSINVTVNATRLSGGDSDLTVSPGSLTFTPTNWSTPQTVTVSAAPDSDTSAGTAVIQLTATSLASVDVDAMEDDTTTAPRISDDFTASNSNWTNVSGGTWTVTGGKLQLTAPAVPSGSQPTGNIRVHNSGLSGNFTCTVDASVTANSGSAWDDFAVIFGYASATNYYFASFNESNDAGTNGLFYYNGSTSTQLVDFTALITPGTNYTIKVEYIGTTLKVYRGPVGGTLTLYATHTVTLPAGGKVGVGSKNDAATFDNILVP